MGNLKSKREFISVIKDYIIGIVKKEDFGNIIAIAAILFTSLVITNAKYIIYVLAITIATLIYAVYLIIKNPVTIKKIFTSYHFLWITLFAILMFIYGFFGENQAEYSFKFHMLNIAWLMILLVILHNNSGSIIDAIAKSSSIVIIMMSLFILITNLFGTTELFTKDGTLRFGFTAVGNKNTTAISYIFLLIPLIYKIGIDKEKKYNSIALLGIFFMILTGSKKAIISLIFMIAIIFTCKSKGKNELFKNLLRVALIIAIIVMLCYWIPILHTLIWERFESMIISLTKFDIEDQSSTGLRMNFIITAFTKAWDKPILGHGWASFAPMYGYSSLYNTNLYTHNNYAEVLFSFGLFGFILYYWFPIRMIIKTIKNKEKNTKIFCWIYIINLLFIDFGTVSCYSTIIGFLGFSIVSLVLQDKGNINILEKISCQLNKRKEVK